MKKSVTKKNEFGVDLRPYQERDVKIISEQWTKDNAILYQLPTGGGKSVVMSKLVWDHQTEKILILAHRKELLVQMRTHLQKHGLKVGLIVRNQHEDLDANIIIASIKTIARDKRLDLILEQNFDSVIVDEAHRILTNSYDKVLTKLKEQNKNLKLFGATATPYRTDNKAFNNLFNTLITSESTQDLINAGYLANYKTYFTPTKGLDEEVQKYFNDYQTSSLSKYMQKDDMIAYAIRSYKELGQGKQAIVFCVDREHAKKVQQTYVDSGYKTAAYLDGNTPLDEREQMLVDYTNKKISHIICIETLTEGVDLPETGCIQLLRPTLSLTLYLQMIGRGLRPKADGSDLIILDNAGCAVQFGTASSPKQWSLNPDIDPNEGRKRNKIIGRKKDGSLTDDTEDMEFSELIEMSPEEYIAQASNSIQKAEETNKKIDEEIQAKMNAIGELFIKKLKDAENWKIIPQSSSYYIKECITIENKKFRINSTYLQINIETRSDTFHIEPENNFSTCLQHFPLIAHMKMTIGELYKLLMVKSFYDEIHKEWSKIKTIEEKKVDITELRRLINDAEADQFERSVDRYLETNDTFILDSNDVYMSSHFRGYYGSYDRIWKITIPNKRVNVFNKVIFTCTSRWDRKDSEQEEKSVKGEKIIEILKRANWAPKVKELA